MNDNIDMQYDETLKELFQEMPLETPSIDFTQALMSRVTLETEKKRERQRWATVALVASGIIAILLIPVIVLYFLQFEMPQTEIFRFSLFMDGLKINPSLCRLALIVLLLLIGDTLFRQRIRRRREC